MSSFKISISITITLRQKSNGVTRSRRRTGSLSVELQDREKACSMQTTRNSFGLLHLGYCERNTLKLQLEKIYLKSCINLTTSTFKNCSVMPSHSSNKKFKSKNKRLKNLFFLFHYFNKFLSSLFATNVDFIIIT